MKEEEEEEDKSQTSKIKKRFSLSRSSFLLLVLEKQQSLFTGSLENDPTRH
jgi:hypothetical protein